jgi:hypothetical protein
MGDKRSIKKDKEQKQRDYCQDLMSMFNLFMRILCLRVCINSMREAKTNFISQSVFSFISMRERCGERNPTYS